MTRPRLVNLLDDFALGGVSRGLGIFASAPLRAAAQCSVVGIAHDAFLAPRLDADIIVTNFPPNWRRLAFMASLRLRNPRARIIHVEHSYTPAWEALKVGNKRLFRLMLKLAMRLVDHLVCVSDGQAIWLQQVARVPTDGLSVIHPYSENPGLGTIPLPDFGRAGRLRIGAYGRFHEQKGFDQLIAAYRAGAMPGVELVIGGFGADEAHLHELAGGDPGIRFAGKIDDVAGFLAACDMVAVPSRWEAYGQVANEAREAGRPILVAPVDGLPEQVGEAGLVVDFSCPGAVAAAMASLDGERLLAMARAGRQATHDCAIQRQHQWASLIRWLAAVGPGRVVHLAHA